MIVNHLRIAVRTLIRKRGYSSTSVLGLGVGLGCCLVITFFVLDELSYDRYHSKKDRIYRLVTSTGSGNAIAKIAGRWGLAAKEEIPEVEDMTRIIPAGQMLFSHGDKLLYEDLGRYADSTTFHVFSYPLLEGNMEKALAAPGSVVLTRSLKEKYFGSEPALGKSLNIEGEEFLVTGVIADVPANSHFSFTYLLSMSSFNHPDKDDWVRWNQYYTYLLLREGSSPGGVPAKMSEILTKNLGAETSGNYSPFLQPLTRIHLHSHLFREMNPNSDVMYVYIFSSIAVLILLISSANFTNLATSQAVTRAKEIGVRKVNGAHRRQLMYQFLTEAAVICLLGLVLAQLFASASFPIVNELTGKQMHLDYVTYPLALVIIMLVAGLTAIFAGAYPAFYLSSLQPSQVIKGKWSPSGRNLLRKGLVTFQFVLSSLLVIASIVIQQQLHFINTRPMGFDAGHVINIPIQSEYLRTHHETVRKELQSLPGVMEVALSGNLPGGSDWGIPAMAEGFTDETMPPLRVMAIDPGFIDTYGMEIVAGRGFSNQLASDSLAYLINEEAARQLSVTEPLSKTIGMPAIGRPQGPVVGVVKDFHFRSMHEKIGPLLFFMPPAGWYSMYSVKIDAARTDDALKAVEGIWARFDPSHPFTFNFFDETFNQLYQQENRLAKVVNYFTVIGVLLACLGLYSLASLTTDQRTKEIGIRKVIGATSGQIVVMLSRQYIILVFIGFVVALPLALWALSQWLKSFAYHDDFSVWLIAAGCGLSMGVALLAVGYRSWQAANLNPVTSLRTE